MPLTLRPSACSPTVPRSSPSCTIQAHDMMLARFQQSFWAIRSQTSRGEQKRIGRIQRLRRRTCSGTALCFFFAPSSPRGRRQQFLTGCLARPARQLKCMHAHACTLARLPACLPACLPAIHARVTRVRGHRHAPLRVSVDEPFDHYRAPATSLFAIAWLAAFLTADGCMVNMWQRKIAGVF